MKIKNQKSPPKAPARHSQALAGRNQPPAEKFKIYSEGETYDPRIIEPRWQKVWQEEKIYQPDLDTANGSASHSTLRPEPHRSDSKRSPRRQPFYNLMMFPYPSAEGLHVGNVFTFSGIDAYGRFKRMQGYEVFQPFGLDGFGIHSENYAIKVGRTPQEHAGISEEHFYEQMHMIGNGNDWSRKVETYKPDYYKWTQWLFIELFKAGLAYKAKATVNFCPSCKTVLSDEQVLQKTVILSDSEGSHEAQYKDFKDSSPKAQNDNKRETSIGICERCETPVEKKELEQWFFRITEYAERLLANTEKLDWTEKIKIAQKNWIGKKIGATIRFKIPHFANASRGKQDLRFKNSDQNVILNESEGSLTSKLAKDSSPKAQNDNVVIEVFTTRPDTLLGTTFLVVAPEHPLVAIILDSGFRIQDSRRKDIQEYVEDAGKKDAQERLTEEREKTGLFSGLYAVNPVNGEQIPIWIADYVLMDYGTGAIMAVPAHDQRDFEFASKYNLPIKQVIAPETGIKRPDEERRDGGCGIIFDPETQKYAVSKHPDGLIRLFAGGVDEGEDLEKGILREVTEESGLYNFTHIEKIQTAFTHFYNRRKKVNRSAWAICYLVILRNRNQLEKKLEAHEKDMELVWLDPADILDNWKKHNQEKDVDHWIGFLYQAVGRAIELGYDKTNDPKIFQQSAYVGEGIIINSGDWNNWQTQESIDKVISWLEEKKIGKRSVNYHLRDWLISRQRYWGPPIPMIYCEKCAGEGKSWFTQNRHSDPDSNREKNLERSFAGAQDDKKWGSAGWYPEENLPVLLPVVEDFKPLGTPLRPAFAKASVGRQGSEGQAVKSPLGNHPEFYETTCPHCGGEAVRETDVSDTFLDSSWYFFRYLATERDDLPFPMKSGNNVILSASEGSNEVLAKDSSVIPQNDALEDRLKWLPVTSYIGGAEHAVLHLLYSRFITMVLCDLGYIDFDEPFTRFRANGLIIKNGAKMSKSKGNVINPDDYVRKYGADTLRTYLGFIGPFTQGGDFQDSGIEGVNRFLKRVWNLVNDSRFKIQDSRTEDKDRMAMMHKTVKGVTEDMEELRFNTAIAKLMTYYNYLTDQEKISREEIEVLLKLLAPFAPHMTEELYQRIKIQDSRFKNENTNDFTSIHLDSWPEYDPQKIVSDTVTIAIQINGKLRDTISVQQSAPTESGSAPIKSGSVVSSQQEIEQLAKERKNVKRYLEGKEIKKVIYVEGKIINFVV